jgi:adenylate kinase
MAHIVLLGGPGAGKGTQAGRLQRLLSIPHISTGAIIRNEIAQGTTAGRAAREYVEAGDLVPDEIAVEIVHHRLASADCAAGFILDGYRRGTDRTCCRTPSLSVVRFRLSFIL